MGYLVQARYVVSSCIKETPPRWMRPQRRENDLYVSLKVTNNTSKLVARGYITEGVIFALTYLFSVPKGTYDIRMVFDANVIGLNDYLWDLNFMLPSMVILPIMLGPEMHIVNIDLGEMFYNFLLSSVLAKY